MHRVNWWTRAKRDSEAHRPCASGASPCAEPLTPRCSLEGLGGAAEKVGVVAGRRARGFEHRRVADARQQHRFEVRHPSPPHLGARRVDDLVVGSTKRRRTGIARPGRSAVPTSGGVLTSCQILRLSGARAAYTRASTAFAGHGRSGGSLKARASRNGLGSGGTTPAGSRRSSMMFGLHWMARPQNFRIS